MMFPAVILRTLTSSLALTGSMCMCLYHGHSLREQYVCVLYTVLESRICVCVIDSLRESYVWHACVSQTVLESCMCVCVSWPTWTIANTTHHSAVIWCQLWDSMIMFLNKWLEEFGHFIFSLQLSASCSWSLMKCLTLAGILSRGTLFLVSQKQWRKKDY